MESYVGPKLLIHRLLGDIYANIAGIDPGVGVGIIGRNL
jgi:hypothetical protein